MLCQIKRQGRLLHYSKSMDNEPISGQNSSGQIVQTQVRLDQFEIPSVSDYHTHVGIRMIRIPPVHILNIVACGKKTA